MNRDDDQDNRRGLQQGKRLEEGSRVSRTAQGHGLPGSPSQSGERRTKRTKAALVASEGGLREVGNLVVLVLIVFLFLTELVRRVMLSKGNGVLTGQRTHQGAHFFVDRPQVQHRHHLRHQRHLRLHRFLDSAGVA